MVFGADDDAASTASGMSTATGASSSTTGGPMNVSQQLTKMADGMGASKLGLASAARQGALSRGSGVNTQLMQVLRSGATGGSIAQIHLKNGSGTANVDLKRELTGAAKHKRTTQHTFTMSCQQPPVLIKWFPQSCYGERWVPPTHPPPRGGDRGEDPGPLCCAHALRGRATALARSAGNIEHVELLLDVRGEPTPEKHQVPPPLPP